MVVIGTEANAGRATYNGDTGIGDTGIGDDPQATGAVAIGVVAGRNTTI
jgi:hypothetical protein